MDVEGIPFQVGVPVEGGASGTPLGLDKRLKKMNLKVACLCDLSVISAVRSVILEILLLGHSLLEILV